MEYEKNGYYTLITGASAGIGKQIAIECAKRNLNLFLVSLPNSGGEEFAHKLKTTYMVDVLFLPIDLTHYRAPRQVYSFAKKSHITVDKLINNAGVGFNGDFDALKIEMADKMILLNIRAATLLTMLFLPDMRKLRKAHILNISSFAAFSPVPLKSVYSASKTYLLFLTKSLNSELQGTGIKVTSIHPTGVLSERTRASVQNSTFIARISALTPEVVAKVAVKNMLNGKKFIVPGLVSKIYYYFGIFIPHGLILRYAGSIFKQPD